MTAILKLMNPLRNNTFSLACCAAWLLSIMVGHSQTLESALDTMGLVWTNSPSSTNSAPWNAINSSAASDVIDYAQSGPVVAGGDSFCQTTVTGPVVVSFWWRVYSDIGLDFLEFRVNEEIVEEITGYGDTEFDPTPWTYVSYTITNVGPVNLKWNYTRDPLFSSFSGFGRLDQVRFVYGPSVSLAQALNTAGSFAAWTTGGNANQTFWAGQTNISHGDGMSAESGALKELQESWMETTVFAVTNVSFWWKISSFTNFGNRAHLAFLVNGVTNSVINGEVDWQSKTNIALPSGTNTLRWAYYTDDLSNTGGRGWVDQVVFSPTFAPSDTITLSKPVLSNGTAQFNVTNKIGWPCKVLYSTNLAANEWILLMSTNTTSSATFSVTDTNAGSSQYRFYRAVSP